MPGASTSRIVNRLREQLVRPVSSADVVIVALGRNDGSPSYRAYADTLSRICELFPRQSVVWIGPAFSLDNNVHRRHARARDFQRRYFTDSAYRQPGFWWFDSFPVTRAGHRSDGVHFTREGYRRWARAVARFAKRKLPKRREALIAVLAVASVVLATASVAKWQKRASEEEKKRD